jgi:hypothetical protein
MVVVVAFSGHTSGAEVAWPVAGEEMRVVGYEKALPSITGVGAIFVLAWLVVRTRAQSPILTLIVAVGWTAFAGAYSLYYWRRDNYLKSTHPLRVLRFFGGIAGVLALWFLANCEFAGVDALDSTQWSKLWVSLPRSSFLLAGTSALFLSVAVATFLRIGTLRLLGLLSRRWGGGREPGTSKPIR